MGNMGMAENEYHEKMMRLAQERDGLIEQITTGRASERELQAEIVMYREALRGWEVRGSDDQQYHSVERGTVAGHDWEQIVEGLSYEQAEAIEDFLRAVLAGTPAEEQTT